MRHCVDTWRTLTTYIHLLSAPPGARINDTASKTKATQSDRLLISLVDPASLRSVGEDQLDTCAAVTITGTHRHGPGQ